AKALMPLVREGAEGVYGLHLELRALEPFVDPREEWERNLLRVEASLQGLRENWERERGYWEEAHQGAASRQRALEEAGRKVDGLL
ncbi:hypothetical protein, partial [Klebsiella pneumoniae]|uniref:hypothetical protein n=1 Tax=Klebsiella pneumoniae TaxID=573 RepID=UPI003B5AE47B